MPGHQGGEGRVPCCEEDPRACMRAWQVKCGRCWAGCAERNARTMTTWIPSLSLRPPMV